MLKNYYGCADSITKDDKRQKEWLKQRKERGFDDTELWNLDFTIICFIYPRLKAFSEKNIGYPSFLEPEEWKEELNKMVKAFEIMSDGERYYQMTKEDEVIVYEGFKLFSERFFHLWS